MNLMCTPLKQRCDLFSMKFIIVCEKYHILEDRVYDIELIELVKKVPKPKEVKVGAKREFT